MELSFRRCLRPGRGLRPRSTAHHLAIVNVLRDWRWPREHDINRHAGLCSGRETCRRTSRRSHVVHTAHYRRLCVTQIHVLQLMWPARGWQPFMVKHVAVNEKKQKHTSLCDVIVSVQADDRQASYVEGPSVPPWRHSALCTRRNRNPSTTTVLKPPDIHKHTHEWATFELNVSISQKR